MRETVCHVLGWQFDSDVQLLRGDDLPAGTAPEDVQLLAFIDRLCRERPNKVRVLEGTGTRLCPEREVLQKLSPTLIDTTFQFRWDDTVPRHHRSDAGRDGSARARIRSAAGTTRLTAQTTRIGYREAIRTSRTTKCKSP